jgi:hypothetical protein
MLTQLARYRWKVLTGFPTKLLFVPQNLRSLKAAKDRQSTMESNMNMFGKRDT